MAKQKNRRMIHGRQHLWNIIQAIVREQIDNKYTRPEHKVKQKEENNDRAEKMVM
jgi:hypothetical protein